MKRDVNVLSGRCPQNHKCPAIWACPVGAIKQSGNKAPEIDKEKCTKCGICVNYCPYGAFRQ